MQKKYNLNSFLSSRNPRNKMTPIPGFGIGEKGRDTRIQDPEIAIHNGRTKLVYYVISCLFVVCLSCIYCISFVSLSNVSSFFFILFLCLAYIFCVPFVYLSNVCSFSLLFSYVAVLARLSQVLLHSKIKNKKQSLSGL